MDVYISTHRVVDSSDLLLCSKFIRSALIPKKTLTETNNDNKWTRIEQFFRADESECKNTLEMSEKYSKMRHHKNQE